MTRQRCCKDESSLHNHLPRMALSESKDDCMLAQVIALNMLVCIYTSFTPATDGSTAWFSLAKMSWMVQNHAKEPIADERNDGIWQVWPCEHGGLPPEGMEDKGGSRQYWWNSASQPSHSRMCLRSSLRQHTQQPSHGQYGLQQPHKM